MLKICKIQNAYQWKISRLACLFLTLENVLQSMYVLSINFRSYRIFYICAFGCIWNFWNIKTPHFFTIAILVKWTSKSSEQCSKPKIGVRVRLPKDEHVQCPFDVPSTVQRTFNEHQTTMKNAIFHEISIIGGFQLLTKELFPNILSGKSY